MSGSILNFLLVRTMNYSDDISHENAPKLLRWAGVEQSAGEVYQFEETREEHERGF